VILLAVALCLTGCGGDDGATPPASGATTTTPTDPDAPTTAAAGQAFVSRLAAVRATDLRLGAAFNTQFLTLQFLAVGLDGTESACAAGRVATAAGDEFATRPVGSVMSGAGITPDVLVPCVPTERIVELSRSAGDVDLGRAPAGVLRSTLSELAAAGYEAAGLTASEATCLADHVVGTYADEDLADVMTTLSLPADRAVAALTTCVTAARAAELGA